MYAVATASIITISFGYPNSPDDEPIYARPSIYRSQPILEDYDARRWMRGSFPPPVEVELASLPLPEAQPACELPRQPSRLIARARGRRPMRGRAGRPPEVSA